MPDLPTEPQEPRSHDHGYTTQCMLCSAEYDCADEADAERQSARMNTEAAVDLLRRLGYVVYKKRPHMRGGKVRLANGTVLVQTTVEEIAGGG